jgi:hypothetical protein
MIKNKVARSTYQKGVIAVALVIIVALTLVVGGIYAYSKHNSESSTDALIRSAQEMIKSGRPPQNAAEMYALLAYEKNQLLLETEKLNALRAAAIDSAIIAIYDGVDDSLSNTQINTTKAVGRKIEAVRNKILKIFEGWKIIRTSGGGGNSAALTEAINRDISSVLAYIDELKNIVKTLTPENSGMTQAEIDALKLAINNISNNIDNSTNILIAVETGTPPTTSNGSTNPTTVIPPDITNQQNVVNDINNIINNVQNQINNLPPSAQPSNTPPPTSYGNSDYGYYFINGPSSFGGIIYPPNPAPTKRPRPNSGPQLIEGTNDL